MWLCACAYPRPNTSPVRSNDTCLGNLHEFTSEKKEIFLCIWKTYSQCWENLCAADKMQTHTKVHAGVHDYAHVCVYCVSTKSQKSQKKKPVHNACSAFSPVKRSATPKSHILTEPECCKVSQCRCWTHSYTHKHIQTQTSSHTHRHTSNLAYIPACKLAHARASSVTSAKVSSIEN
jgi:hypothetical protein